MTDYQNLPPLNQLSKQEFRDATRYLKPMTEEEFDMAWQKFQAAKRLKGMN